MIKNISYKIIYFLFIFSSLLYSQEIFISSEQIINIGNMIFENECASNNENLVSWNKGENFISLGLGHFIWYSKNKKEIFKESFPLFLKFAKNKKGIKIPKWLDKEIIPSNPWNSRDEFLNSQNDKQLIELKEFLIKTKSLQTIFIIKNLKKALPLMLKYTEKNNYKNIILQFKRVTSTVEGVYALIDYINFKGLGIISSERYNNKGWGLLQVLTEMKNEKESSNALEEFVRSANKIIDIRISNSPKERNEQKWSLGWKKRINSYIKKNN